MVMAIYVYLYDKSKYICNYGDPYGPVLIRAKVIKYNNEINLLYII